MKEMVCIVCPRGCHLKVDDDMNVTGNTCPRGKIYALNELTHPTRMLTTTVRVKNRPHTVVSVKTTDAIDKNRIFEAMELINKLALEAPLHVGDVAIKNIFDSGVDIVVTKNID